MRVWPKNLVITHTVQYPLLWWPSMKTTCCLSFYHLLLCRYVHILWLLWSDGSRKGGSDKLQCQYILYIRTLQEYNLKFTCETIVTLGNCLQATFQHTLLLIFITGLQLIQYLYCFSKHRGLCWSVRPAGLSISLVCLLISLLIFIFCR